MRPRLELYVIPHNYRESAGTTYLDNSVGNPFKIEDVPNFVSKGRSVVYSLLVLDNGVFNNRISHI